MQRWLAGAVTIAGGLWAIAVALTPVVVADDRAPLPSALLYTVGALVCHQRPERSFHTAGVPWLVCARCAGLYGSAALGAALAWRGAPRVPPFIRLLLLVAAAPTALTLALEWSGALQPGNAARAAAAVPLGAAAAWICVRALRAEAGPARCDII